jgi:CheY-like chemotaxis protein
MSGIAGPLCILIAEDDAATATVIATLLRKAGHNVVLASDGALALDEILKGPMRFDLLVTDHFMPRMNGVMLTQSARRAGFVRRIVVFSSAVVGKEPMYQPFGVDTFVTKGVTPDILLAEIERTPRCSGSPEDSGKT